MTEDRKAQGLVLGQSVIDNFALANLPQWSRLGWIDHAQERGAFQRFVDRLRIRLAGPDQPVETLSGGYQQKVLLARWLERNCDLVIFDEPTGGVDVGAKVEIYQRINELACEGKAILMISSELPEVLGMADRILVMHEGRVTGEINDVAGATQEQIMKLAVGDEMARSTSLVSRFLADHFIVVVLLLLCAVLEREVATSHGTAASRSDRPSREREARSRNRIGRSPERERITGRLEMIARAEGECKREEISITNPALAMGREALRGRQSWALGYCPGSNDNQYAFLRMTANPENSAGLLDYHSSWGSIRVKMTTNCINQSSTGRFRLFENGRNIRLSPRVNCWIKVGYSEIVSRFS